MDYTGLKVNHIKKFGEGTIISQNEAGIIQVQFSSDNSIKKFKVPGCFSPDILELLDEDASANAQEAFIKKEKEDEERARQQLYAAYERRQANVTNSRQSSGNISYTSIPPYPSVRAFVSEMQPVLYAELAHVRTTGGKRTKLTDGKIVKFTGDYYIYSFESESELSLPSNTDITLWLPNTHNGIPAFVIDNEDFTVIISTYQNLGNNVPQIEFTTDTWRLLEYLSKRLDALQINPTPIVSDLVCHGPDQIRPSKDIYKGQETALAMSTSQPITFIWGPPGTGKTETLANIALKHMSLGHRILMVSYSNVSVDGAAWRVFNKDPQKMPGKIIRYGYPKDKELLGHDYLTSYNYAIRSHPDLVRERDLFQKERDNLNRTSPRYVELGKKLIGIRNQLHHEERRAVSEASFVATTVSKAIADKTIFEDNFDVVVFDEASMAYIPQIVFAASLATKNFICMGDFSQLPPIVQNSSSSILNYDIFQYCGIVRAVTQKACHEWLCLLDTQYRMHPAIANFSSKAMYQGLLKSGSKMEEKRQEIVAAKPFNGNELHLVDLSGMRSICHTANDQSHINVMSAMISLGLAIHAASSKEVGIITPYQAQSKLLHAMARDAKELDPELKEITCATVHQFQGSEKDIIIYDAVDCYLQRLPGVLLTNLDNNYANRLFNVAITRARGKMITVTHVDYMKSRLNNKLIFHQLLEQLSFTRRSTRGQIVLEEVNSNILHSYNSWAGGQAFLSDLEKAKNSIFISIPHGIAIELEWLDRFSALLTAAKNRNVKIDIRTDRKSALPGRLQKYAVSSKYVFDPIVIIDKRITWYGMPKSTADFKIGGVSEPTKFRPILRFEGTHFAQTLSALK